MTLLYGTPTHVVEWLDFPYGEALERWRVVKGPWNEASCLQYVAERHRYSAYPERYRVRAV